nr:PREDICTED: uncharacterized protein LOC104965258 [Notothenia coriiceps]
MYPGDSCVWATSLWGLGSDKHLFLLWLRLHHPRHHLQCPVMFDGARHLCEHTVEERVERVLSPRLQLEVSCSEVYQFNTQGWRLDVDRMRVKHGGDDGIALYYKQQGPKASCFVYKLPEIQNLMVNKTVKACCEGWGGPRCSEGVGARGQCFSTWSCDAFPGVHNASLMPMEQCCSSLWGLSWRNASDQTCLACTYTLLPVIVSDSRSWPAWTLSVSPVDPTPVQSPNPNLSPHLSRPEGFSGDSGDCRAFLAQCGLHFELQAACYPSERSRVAYIISHLSGRAEAWAMAEWVQRSPVCDSLDLFTETFTNIFQQTTQGREAARALVGLRQGKQRVSDYAIKFRTLAGDSDWNQQVLFDAFRYGLSGTLKDQLAPLELPADLDSLISLTIKIDKRLLERERERERDCDSLFLPQEAVFAQLFVLMESPQDLASVYSASPLSPAVPEEPMLTPEERQRRLWEGRCFYCGERGHSIAYCR